MESFCLDVCNSDRSFLYSTWPLLLATFNILYSVDSEFG